MIPSQHIFLGKKYKLPWAVLETSGTVFPNTDRPRPVNDISVVIVVNQSNKLIFHVSLSHVSIPLRQLFSHVENFLSIEQIKQIREQGFHSIRDWQKCQVLFLKVKPRYFYH